MSRVAVTNVDTETIEDGFKAEITVVRMSDNMFSTVHPRVADLPDDIVEAMYEWLTNR